MRDLKPRIGEQSPLGEPTAKWRGLGYWLWLLVMWLVISRFSLDWGGLVVMSLTAIGYLVETRTRRPRRSFYRLALASTALFLLLVVGFWDGYVVLAFMTWAAITALAAAWTIHYERTELRD